MSSRDRGPPQRAAGEPDLRVDRDVVALIRTGRRTLIAAARSAAPAAAPALSARRRCSRRGLAVAADPARRAPRCAAEPAGPGRSRGELTIAARSARSSGTLITSSRNRAVFGSSMPPSVHPGTSSADRTAAVPDT